jgi:hypothetical protein
MFDTFFEVALRQRAGFPHGIAQKGMVIGHSHQVPATVRPSIRNVGALLP